MVIEFQFYCGMTYYLAFIALDAAKLKESVDIDHEELPF